MRQVSERAEVELKGGEAAFLAPIEPHMESRLFSLFSDVVARGEGFPQTPPLTRSQFEDVWVRPVSITIAAVIDATLVGAYYLRPNQPGLGSHIANAGYVVDRGLRGHGLGKKLLQDSAERAPFLGFDAIQFNFVFESNPARAMYEQLGWLEIGRVPRAVLVPGREEPEPALIYWRPLTPAGHRDKAANSMA